MAVPPLPELMRSAKRSAVHLEMRDIYGVADEAADFAAWRDAGRGDREIDPDSERWKPWLDLVRETVARGVVIRRARVVSMPVTDYIRFEYGGTPLVVAAGEQVRWLPRHDASNLLLPGNDLWLFDDSLVRFGIFSGDGALIGHQIIDDPEVAAAVAGAFEKVWERGTPHNEFQI